MEIEPKLTWKKLLIWLKELDQPVSCKMVEEKFNVSQGHAWILLNRLRLHGDLVYLKDKDGKNKVFYTLTKSGKNRWVE